MFLRRKSKVQLSSYELDEYTEYLKHLPYDKIKNYIEKRVINQIIWYDKKSIIKQNKYKYLMVTTFILNTLIPILTIFFASIILNDNISKFVVTALSATSSAILSVLSFFNYHDLWVQYRTNCEILKSILHRYFTGTGEFVSGSDEDNFNTLVVLCEDYLTKEFGNWVSTVNKFKSENNSYSCTKS